MEPAFPELAPGDRLGPYELCTELGQGGMGIVWLATADRQKFFAIKVLKHAAPAGAWFEDEVRLLRRLQHPKLVGLHDVGFDQGVRFLVTEYVHGASVLAMQETIRMLPVEIALRIARDVAEGLVALHDLRAEDGSPLRAVHRDVTPHNILVSTDGQARLIDFGIAKFVDRHGPETTRGTFKGKVRYASPEQLFGKPTDLTTDLWALGVGLWFMITHEYPFKSEVPAELVRSVLMGRRASEHPRIPAGVMAIFGRLLNPEPTRRFASALEVIAAIDNCGSRVASASDLGDCVRRAMEPSLVRLSGAMR